MEEDIMKNDEEIGEGNKKGIDRNRRGSRRRKQDKGIVENKKKEQNMN